MESNWRVIGFVTTCPGLPYFADHTNRSYQKNLKCSWTTAHQSDSRSAIFPQNLAQYCNSLLKLLRIFQQIFLFYIAALELGRATLTHCPPVEQHWARASILQLVGLDLFSISSQYQRHLILTPVNIQSRHSFMRKIALKRYWLKVLLLIVSNCIFSVSCCSWVVRMGNQHCQVL